MIFFERINRIFINLRHFILARVKLFSWLILLCLVIIVASGIGLYLTQQNEQSDANKFYEVAQSINKTDNKEDMDQKIQAYLKDQKDGLFKNYMATLSINEKISRSKFDDASKTADEITLNSNDPLISQIMFLQRAKAYILAKDYTAALESLDKINLTQLADIKALYTARIKILQGDKIAAADTLSDVMIKNEKSTLIEILKNYQTLTR